ncbi:MAG: choice-of-anchor K domain-containing protein [Verrucomicrobiota bacterium]
MTTTGKFNLPSSRKNRRGNAGMTLVEVLAITGAVALLATAGLATYYNTTAGSKSTGLVNHVKQLNSAVNLYQANGGLIETSDDFGTVLAKLKTASAGDDRKTNVGLRGSMVDQRLLPVMQSSSQAATDETRVIWSGSSKRFEIANSGGIGATEFKLHESAIPTTVVAAHQERHSNLKLAQNSGWVWDYTSFSESGSGGVYQFSQAQIADLSPSIFTSNGGATISPPAGPEQLLQPLFSLDGGDYDYRDFNLEVMLFNPNEEGSSSLIYAVNSGSWEDYTDGQLIYAGPHDTIHAMAVSDDLTQWTDSDPKEETYVSSFIISGGTSGSFSNASGGRNMSTGGSGGLFQWGTPYYYGGFTDPSWILFNGASFYDVAPGEQFELGTLTYYNGTIFTGTEANSVDLNVDLSFDDGGGNSNFNYTLELINVGNDDNAWSGNSSAFASADYVHLDNIYSTVDQSLGGTDYTLQIEFGETTSQGFSTIDSFYVIEEGTATGTLYGTLIPAVDPLTLDPL